MSIDTPPVMAAKGFSKDRAAVANAQPQDWLSPDEAAARLGRSRRTVERAIKDGTLPSFRWRGCRMISARALDRSVRRGER